MATCVNLSTMQNYQRALNALSLQYSNWTIHRIPIHWMLTKQCYAVSDPNRFSEATIIQTTFLASGQYLFSMIVLLMILLLFRRATTSIITKDDSLAYLFKDLIALLKLLHWKNCDYLHIAFTTSCFLVFIALLPLLLTLWLCMLCYRHHIHHTIKRKYGDKFRGFLDGSDAVWALEDDFAKSVINIMALVEINVQSNNSAADSAVNILLALRKRLSLRFLGEYKTFPKLFYKRCKEHGYSFWTNENECTIEDYIRFMPNITEAAKHTDNKKYIESAFGALCNMPLMNNHSASWEILVSKRHITDYNSEGNLATHIPVLFRIHHSLGDGVALLRLFLETIADRENSKKNLWTNCIHQRQKLKTYFENEFSPPTFVQKFSIWKSIASMNAREFQRIWNRLKLYVQNLATRISILFLSPASIVQQGFKKIDENTLHQQKLTGDKIICWHFENDDDLDLLDTMKAIKRNFQGVRFSDVLLSALSISFQNYFESKGHHIPNTMTAVLPARIEAEGAQLKLQNKFSVGLQTLPIRGRQFVNTQASRFHSKMMEVKKYSDLLRSSPDYFVNYWIMSFLSSLLPESMLSSLTESVHSTIAVSNLPGPQTITYISGYRISNMTFWLPNRGSTGIGISILSYGYKLQLGLIGDRAVISNQYDAQRILDGAVNEIRNMAFKKYNLKRNSVAF
ncbi:uncharacterized protein LOC129577418 [Sitodiplosis mosellana]|uniref:uncharacterized protein LOC129577418 n=1 Tax=Sitodiplosis mosellana TaxID=263140 RepID=UPI002443F670|nr:uncharacterized protein LOC129577418 [Sitodiplosis mosellana]